MNPSITEGESIFTVGMIGYRNHCKKLQRLVENTKNSELVAIYHPQVNIQDSRGTNDLSNLYPLDIVIVGSPNHTHYNYLKLLLENSNCKIFCEKPPVISHEQLDWLSNLEDDHKHRLYFNFNYRFNHLNRILTNKQWLNALGKIINIYCVSTHGLAFKKEYINSWRADSETNPHAVLETVVVHYLDLFVHQFGYPIDFQYSPTSQSGQENGFDTTFIKLDCSQQLSITLFSSYAAPFRKLVEITGTEGYMEIDSNEARVFAPRDTFDQNGRFASSPLLFKEKIDEGDIMNSLQNSFSYFMSFVQEHNPLPQNHFNTSIDSNRLVLKMADSYNAGE